MSTRLLGLIGLLALAASALPGCTTKPPAQVWPDKPGPRVATTFAALYCLASSVAGPDGTVHTLLSDKGPHGYEFTPADAEKLRGANLLLINGLGLDDELAKKVRSTIGADAKLVAVGEAAVPRDRLIRDEDEDEKDDKDKGKPEHQHGEFDPHVWLGPPEAILMVEKIRDELTALDPAHADGYRQRAADTAARLRKLHEDGKALLKDKKDRQLVTFHESLRYFARAYDLKIAGVVEVTPGTEPGIAQLNELIKHCEKEHVRLIAVEPQYSAKNAGQTLLDELRKSNKVPDAAFVEIDPIETGPPEGLTLDYYEKTMRQNLDNLAKTMK
jgi:ABC-type Zn uptake system ZnuABC Zn-binding protein ZnuA